MHQGVPGRGRVPVGCQAAISAAWKVVVLAIGSAISHIAVGTRGPDKSRSAQGKALGAHGDDGPRPAALALHPPSKRWDDQPGKGLLQGTSQSYEELSVC